MQASSVCARASRVDVRRGRLFQHLLVTALHGAVAVAQMNDIAVGVGQNLHFNMARLVEEFFQVDGVVAKGIAGLGLGDVYGVEQGRLRSAPPACRDRRRRRPP